LCGLLRQTVDNLFDLIYDYGSTRQKQSTSFHLQTTDKNVCWRAEGKEFGRIKEGRPVPIKVQNPKVINCAQLYCSYLGALGVNEGKQEG
jgi:hypothetical protein